MTLLKYNCSSVSTIQNGPLKKLEGENDNVQFADDTSIICKLDTIESIP